MKAGAFPEEDFPVADRIAYLIAGYLKGSLSEAEHDELDAWIVASDDNLRLFEQLTDEEYLRTQVNWQKQVDVEAAWQRVREKTGLARGRTWIKSLWPWVVVAGSAAAVLWLVMRPAGQDKTVVVQSEPKSDAVAVLTLGNGRTVVLGSQNEGLVAEEGGVAVSSRGGTLAYGGDGGAGVIHALAIPRGANYQVVLSDGTRVWLNAETKLWFPAHFGKGKREVRISGEGYFEVTKSEAQPFVVHIEQGQRHTGDVEVLGTQFNVQAYPQTAAVATLVEGTIKLRTQKDSLVMTPGQYARMGNQISTGPADVGAVTGWKSGYFVFRNATIEMIGQELERWYDVAFEYQGDIHHLFTATIDRRESLAEVIEVLKATKRVQISTEGRRVIIQP